MAGIHSVDRGRGDQQHFEAEDRFGPRSRTRASERLPLDPAKGSGLEPTSSNPSVGHAPPQPHCSCFGVNGAVCAVLSPVIRPQTAIPLPQQRRSTARPPESRRKPACGSDFCRWCLLTHPTRNPGSSSSSSGVSACPGWFAVNRCVRMEPAELDRRCLDGPRRHPAARPIARVD